MDITDLLSGLLSQETRALLFDLIVGLSAASALLRRAADAADRYAARTSTTADDKAARVLGVLAGSLEWLHRTTRPFALRGVRLRRKP